MAERKRLTAEFFYDSAAEKAVFKEQIYQCNDHGADAVLIWDGAKTDIEHEDTIGVIKEIAREIDCPIITGGYVKRLEDVKKYLYAGAKAVILEEDTKTLQKETADRFGSEKLYLKRNDGKGLKRYNRETSLVFSASAETDGICDVLKQEETEGVIFPGTECTDVNFIELKQQLSANGIETDVLKSAKSWSEFKTNSDGLVPVIVQDYRTSEVLMLAYMNEQAYEDTIRTGMMHYYSRSRKTQWLKGETSGHLQYVKSLTLDCDQDTILAKVHQIGPACHTGAKSCFFQPLVQRDYKENDPFHVLSEVYQVILDRKEHPKEGSYTNYLFEKGIDKILKKVGEEATEIVIAAKNPDPEEIKYEISDFLYHVMVLMAVKGVTWEEIMQELSNR